MNKNYYGFNIPKVEDKYNAKYVGDFEIKENLPVLAVFYQNKPDETKGHSNYFGLFVKPLASQMYICDASEVLNQEYPGIELPDGEYLISTYNHDYKEKLIDNQFYMIDGGGRVYTRFSPPEAKIHRFKVQEDKLVKYDGIKQSEHREDL